MTSAVGLSRDSFLNSTGLTEVKEEDRALLEKKICIYEARQQAQ